MQIACHLHPSLRPKLCIKTTRTTGRQKMRQINHAPCELETEIFRFRGLIPSLMWALLCVVNLWN